MIKKSCFITSLVGLCMAVHATESTNQFVYDRPVPRPALVERLKNGPDVIGIVHWGLNTYTDREWGFGDENPQWLNPTNFSASQIVGACKDGGLGGLVIVAKHHDGFCLWPTKTTQHNISKSPFRDGKGDYVREMEQACRKNGLKFGIYVSPWDRNNEHYSTEKYVEIYHNQIKELLNGDYGEIFEMWFDGANGGDGWYGGNVGSRKIKPEYYRFDEVYDFIKKLQPSVTTFNGEYDASDFRWPGNERGELNPDSRATIVTVGGLVNGSYANPDYGYVINTGLPSGNRFRVCEGDFPQRPGWFYHAKEDGHTKNSAYLLKCYLNTVGNGGTMNLGIAPTRDGRLTDEDVRSLKGFKLLKDALFANEVTAEEGEFNVVVMEEDIAGGEQVDNWILWGDKRSDGSRARLLQGRSIGRRRIRLISSSKLPRSCSLEITQAGPGLRPVSVRRYRADPELISLIKRATTDSGETDTAKWMTIGR